MPLYRNKGKGSMSQEILNKTYITIADVYAVLPIGKNYASKVFRELEAELHNRGIPTFNTRPRVIPTEIFLERFPELKKGQK